MVTPGGSTRSTGWSVLIQATWHMFWRIFGDFLPLNVR
jgi:hypothetical protein